MKVIPTKLMLLQGSKAAAAAKVSLGEPAG